MAKKEKQKKQKVMKIKPSKKQERKKFFEVDMPLLKKTIELYSINLSGLNNRTVKMDLSRQLKGKGIEITFKIKADEKKAEAIPKILKSLGYYIRRMIRKGTDYVEDSIKTNCKDAEIIIKPFLITRKKVSRKTRKGLRDKARTEITEYVKDKKAEELIKEIMSNKFQKPLSLKLKKIYPLALCEIRHFEILNKKEISEKAEKETKIEKEEVEEKSQIEEIEEEKAKKELEKQKKARKKTNNKAEKETKTTKKESKEKATKKPDKK